MNDKTTEPPKVRESHVWGDGEKKNLFKTADGGRSDYGSLILQALTGLDQEGLEKSIEDKLTADQKVAYKKAVAQNGMVSATLLDHEDQFFLDYVRTTAGPSLIAPPIAPERLARLVAENNALEPCIAAMETNIAGTGFKIVPDEGNEADLTEEQKTTKKNIEDFLKEANPKQSYGRVRKMLRRDRHTTGNSYMVVERNFAGELAFIKRGPAKSMRIVKLDEPTDVTVKVMRGGQEAEISITRAERRFVQRVGTKLIYYKEFGASRDLDRHTGEWAKEGDTRIQPNKRAHEIVHEKDIEDVRSPYGMPRWITQLPSVLGSRMAEEFNLAFFHSGGMPPVIIFITGGNASEEVEKVLSGYLSGTAEQKQRGVVVEIASAGHLDNEKGANIEVVKFGAQDADSTFETYDEKSELRVRRAFRLPGIFLGMADSYNFATAHASYVVAEAQVFKPERDEDDEMMNMTVMRDLDEKGEFRFQSNPLSVQDVNLQLKGLTMVSTVPGMSYKELVDKISEVTGIDIALSEDFAESKVGAAPAITPAGGTEGPPETQGASGGARPPPPPGEGPEGANAVQNREAQVLASQITRAIRDFEDEDDDAGLAAIASYEERYEALTPAAQELVNKAMAPVLFSSPFLTDAAMNEVAAGYALAAFAEAKRKMKETANVV